MEYYNRKLKEDKKVFISTDTNNLSISNKVFGKRINNKAKFG